ncbi:MAG: hypothetical protein QOD71_484 [Thermoleophilaceae bacterium]|jgi:hypothetical protein|nr:hypothetical protein [Thermoleophilaceae bacterium]
MTAQPDPDRLGDSVALVRAAEAAGISLRIIGGLAVQILCPSASHAPLARPCKDLDLVGRSKQRKQIEAFMSTRGYQPARQFNLLHGETQLMFGDSRGTVDVFLDALRMCHTLPLADRLDHGDVTLGAADLLLSKVQIVQTTDRDLLDVVALLKDADIDERRVAEVLAADWGWWRTATEVLERARAFAADLPGLSDADAVQSRADGLLARIESEPKSRRWRMRARVGERMRWYELPDESQERAG